MLLHVGVVVSLGRHGVVVVVGDILHRLQGRSHRLSEGPRVEAGLVVLGRGVVGGGRVHVGHGVTVVVLTLVLPRDHRVRVAICIVVYGSPSELLCLTQLPGLCDALESLIKSLIIRPLQTYLHEWMLIV